MHAAVHDLDVMNSPTDHAASQACASRSHWWSTGIISAAVDLHKRASQGPHIVGEAVWRVLCVHLDEEILESVDILSGDILKGWRQVLGHAVIWACTRAKQLACSCRLSLVFGSILFVCSQRAGQQAVSRQQPSASSAHLAQGSQNICESAHVAATQDGVMESFVKHH